MQDFLYDQIPSLDLADFREGNLETKQKFVQELGKAYQNIGFVAIRNHGLSNELTEKLYASVKKFFELDEKTKRAYEIEGLHGQRGYIGKMKEHAKGSSTPDLKEFFHVGQEVSPDFELAAEYPANVSVKEIADFDELTKEAFQILENTGKQMLQAIALFLQLPEDYFENKVTNGHSILRAIHYFPIENPDSLPSDAVRAAAHGDINLITLLMGASAEGLQVLRRDNKWIPITALPDQIVVNVGDMLERLSNNVLKSTIHRVVNPPKEKLKTSRYSIPFFMHPRSDMNLACLDTCIGEQNPKNYSDITAGEFLNQRLKEIGLAK